MRAKERERGRKGGEETGPRLRGERTKVRKGRGWKERIHTHLFRL